MRVFVIGRLEAEALVLQMGTHHPSVRPPALPSLCLAGRKEYRSFRPIKPDWGRPSTPNHA